ncbi:Tetratricopeptide repeat protein 5 [Nymphon striatum]|nr:Tetratricopeptide repeat protein 5 [Nymphon striatum]
MAENDNNAENSNKSESSYIDEIRTAVEKLYDFRDQYIQENGLERATSKYDDVNAKLLSTIEFINKFKESHKKQDRCYFHLQMGKALNIVPNYDQEAEENLAKAVKLDPKLVEAWNHLGECYWKKGDVNGAKNCFIGALENDRNKVSLRNLSMTLRQLGQTQEEKVKNVEESVNLAKEALKLDVSDGTSWVILGNAYLTSYFFCGQNPKCLKNCMTAFNKAERDPISRGNPDLYFNKGIALKYEEEYFKSLSSFDRACALDPSWTEATEKKKDLISYLCRVQELSENKVGKVKNKKLQNMLSSLSLANLGPYQGGGYASNKGNAISLEQTNLNDLSPGVNYNKVVVGRVVCSVNSEDNVPFTFCIVDSQQSCFCVTVYNLAQGKGVIIGDSVAIPEPYIQKVQGKYENKEFNFSSIRVSNPLVMVVNGKKCGGDKLANSKLSINLMSQ